jgi:hypothetical protein
MTRKKKRLVSYFYEQVVIKLQMKECPLPSIWLGFKNALRM